MASPEDITLTADDTRCARCGRGFDVRTGRYGLAGVPGNFHAECLPKSPAVYRAGLLAGLREAAALADQHAEAMTKRLAKPGLSEFDEGLFESAHTEASYIAAAIRARIAALETEDGK